MTWVRNSGGSLLVPVSSGGATDPYPFYPALDLNTIPWHTGSGAWGTQTIIRKPDPPVITRSVSVSTISGFNTEAATPGTEITVTADLIKGSGSSLPTINVSDIRVIVNPGVRIDYMDIGSYLYPTNQRIEICGPTRGTYSGGIVGFIFLRLGGTGNDVVLDGIGMNGDAEDTFGRHRNLQIESCDGFSVLNCRLIAGGWNFLCGTVTNMVIAGTTSYAGAVYRSENLFIEGWGWRGKMNPLVVYDSHLHTTRYHLLRAVGSSGSDDKYYIANSTLVTVAEAKTMWAGNNTDTPFNPAEALIFDNNNVYSYTQNTVYGSADIDVSWTSYARVRNNNFFSGGAAPWSSGTLSSLLANIGTQPSTHATQDAAESGNTYSSLSATLPAFARAGDPRSLGLYGGAAIRSYDAVYDAGPGALTAAGAEYA